ncbi:hypothetical protein H072_8202 [Dactylellina haptotyla CBS 200.50]|uniref:Uncharacterized protein n=1 Tax=Dactylellina haptotyla (strain CBS 200.50) TaxID=1284197 RepID=S8BFH7_DACHA|nr:hypothetical protein H072_8202 [Dactylellina haptotyla CBS 200.50]
MPAPADVEPTDEACHIFETITHSLGNTVDTLFDIQVIRVGEQSTDDQTILSLQSRNRWRNEADCHDFLESLKSSPPKSTQKIFLLVEDMSLAMLNFLYGELQVPASTIMSHVQDISGSDINSLMELFMPSNNKSSHPTAEGTDSESLHLDDMIISDMGEYGFDFLGAKRKIDIHDTSRFTLDWRYMVWRSAESQSIEDSAILARQQALGSTVSSWGSSFHEDVFKLGTWIHRSHQIIFKRRWQGIQLESMQERASWIPIEYHGHAIEIYFFDPIPTVRNFKNQSISPVFERPKTRIEMLQSDDSVVILESTRTVFEAYMRSWSPLCKSTEDLRRVCQANLIRRNIVVLSDTLTVMEAAIKDMDSKMSKPANIQERIDDWRSQLSSFRPILSEMAHSAQNVSVYLTCMFREVKSSDQNHLVQKEIGKSLSTVKQFSHFRSSVAESTDRTFQALMASMSILESQGAIAQASSVGKLTELAFVFIPISFAATFYSMQIEVRIHSFFAILKLKCLTNSSFRSFIQVSSNFSFWLCASYSARIPSEYSYEADYELEL